MPAFTIRFDTNFMDRLNRLVAAAERQATAAEKLNEILGTPVDDNTIDPARIEALDSQLETSSTTLQTKIDHAATP